MAAPLLEVEGLRCGYGKRHFTEIVHGASFTADAGEFVCVVGANGCGKTTMLKTVMGLLPAVGGSVRIGGEDALRMGERERAKRFAYIPQAHTPPFPFIVADVVLLGRTPYVSGIARVTRRDRTIAYKALELLGITEFAKRPYTQLSGGQQQLVLIARALVQQSDILIMDEPTASLDFGNQQLVLSRMRTLARIGKAVVMVTHDPDHALLCATRVVMMEEGRTIGDGLPEECITTESLRRLYGAQAEVVDATLSSGERERVCVPLL